MKTTADCKGSIIHRVGHNSQETALGGRRIRLTTNLRLGIPKGWRTG